MNDGFQELLRKHRSAEVVHRRYRHDGGDELAHEFCLLANWFVTAEELAVSPLLRRSAKGADLADEMEGRSAAIKHLVARVLETPPADLGDLIAALGEAVAAYTEFVEEHVFVHLREHGVDGAEMAHALNSARDRMHDRESLSRR